jgi:hypothetical protein
VPFDESHIFSSERASLLKMTFSTSYLANERKAGETLTHALFPNMIVSRARSIALVIKNICVAHFVKEGAHLSFKRLETTARQINDGFGDVRSVMLEKKCTSQLDTSSPDA